MKGDLAMSFFLIIIFIYVAIIYIATLSNKSTNTNEYTPNFVPPESIYIIDRNTHYYKTLTSGKRILLGPNDKITSRISKAPVSRTLNNFFETEDGAIISANVTCIYASNDILNTQDLLQSVRRSIDDIILSSLYFAIGSIKSYDLHSSLNKAIEVNLTKELSTLDIGLLSFKVNLTHSDTASKEDCFKPHISGCYHDSVERKDEFVEGPIRYD